ncbi:hypothetical protein PC129_g23876 [Phytophthora cactorum]|uniref:RxLR effector protein n=1 Tax=Phytophthora cactorum TaxID=29920 RepID=A0A329SXF3_9STRA|nr:hypothetical protein Pcac1_g5197 [Phytophthora cactorum]KAG2802245.1 hypothetical protein PC112_g19709 [Phytophthora cactorum]KAG2803085.1 hypothetical protein PC111_g18830 [Phytophthora cactorum]KAG2881740.1 hypothetical protein PC114_g21413 [Phytophthora cactorum]KAG2924967.1 hypothetical protein PC117_g15274 [Phytophthora cactorum]
MRSLFCFVLTILAMLLAATDAASSSISNFETTTMNARLTSTSPTPGLSANEKRNLCGATKKMATEEFNADDEDCVLSVTKYCGACKLPAQMKKSKDDLIEHRLIILYKMGIYQRAFKLMVWELTTRWLVSTKLGG